MVLAPEEQGNEHVHTVPKIMAFDPASFFAPLRAEVWRVNDGSLRSPDLCT